MNKNRDLADKTTPTVLPSPTPIQKEDAKRTSIHIATEIFKTPSQTVRATPGFS
ncbi:hypothetical protein [Rhodopirellula bahusiensis]|uniref:hypothetical protein n=1 Tax=Rhodopirellula bahusiensis TaxID=2014065 RepID=UPI001E3E1BB2|nr:hypothetical protein [Rhodopirellula bahusiensis]